VSFYKQLGGLTGCCVTGAADVVAEVREWRTRHGGTLFALWPYAASALAGMRLRLPRMGAYLERARGIADALSGLDGVRVVPDPPHTPMLHLLLERDAGALRAAALRLAERQGVWTWPRFGPTGVPGVSRAELEVGDGTMGFEPGEVREVVAGLLRG
jgi:threonine aldolase